MKRRSALKILAISAAASPLAARSAEISARERSPILSDPKLMYESSSPTSVFPKVFETGKSANIRIEWTQIPSDAKLVCASEDGFDIFGNPYFPEYRTIFKNSSVEGRPPQPDDFSTFAQPVAFEADGDGIRVKAVFPKEGRYVFALRSGKKTVARAWVYALNSDLFALRPYRGDIHMHSTFSDGKNTNLEMALKGLSLGYDFMAVSDHRRYVGSADLIEKLKDAPLSMSLFNGEEAHASLVHTNNFGSSGGIEEWTRANRADFDARTNRILKTVPASLNLSELDVLTLAQTEAVYERIAETGGLSVFNHPYWRRNGEQLDVSDALRDALISRGKFDAFEIVNGAINYDSTDLCIARHAEAAAEGRYMPIVGCSDAHRADELGLGATIAFAKSNRLADVKEAIKGLKTVAVDSSGGFMRPKFAGKLRLIKYASFLWKNFFPIHDGLCAEESGALGAYLAQKTPETLENLRKKTESVLQFYAKAGFC